ncbi:hypothetical protein [Pedobacter sp. KLB.chiD]|uniref:hypothetical protein n=1 Tax=Pedobacter sp. KLB.chiD TaxID=3387402 RepID=UPI0039997CC7
MCFYTLCPFIKPVENGKTLTGTSLIPAWDDEFYAETRQPDIEMICDNCGNPKSKVTATNCTNCGQNNWLTVINNLAN